MSLPPPGPDAIPEETARLARTINPKGTLYMHIRDQLGAIYEDQSFADLFSTRGQPAEAPWRLVGVITFFRTLFPAKLGGLTAPMPHHAAKKPSLSPF